jgi:hypothetical protein
VKSCILFIPVSSTTSAHHDFASLSSKLVATWSKIQKVITLRCLTILLNHLALLDNFVKQQHHRKPTLEIEWTVMVDLTNTRAQARDVIAATNHEEPPCPTFTRASQTLAIVAALLDTLPTPSTDGVDKVYHQLKYTLQ